MYKLTISYDGTAYHGWQRQPDAPTVSGVLEDRFYKVFGRACVVQGASRTDAGVHAVGQVASLQSDLMLEPERMRVAWNGQLPPDIHIRSIIDEPGFYARHQVRQKMYWYHIFVRRPLPGFARYGYWYRFPFDQEALRNVLQCFVGTHDFRSFCTGDDAESTVRTVDGISLDYVHSLRAYRIVVQGAGFLRYMIRRMVGAALEVAAGRVSSHDMVAIFRACHPEHGLPTAPAQGLMLRKIIYHKGDMV